MDQQEEQISAQEVINELLSASAETQLQLAQARVVIRNQAQRLAEIESRIPQGVPSDG